MKKTISFLLTPVLVLSLCSCSSNNNDAMQDCIVSNTTTYYEDGMFYEAKNSEDENVLCYYSKDSDKSAVMCGLPQCTHISKTSPDCTALCGDVSRYGYNRIGDKLYFIEIDILNNGEGSKRSMDLVECDIDGKNRRVIAYIENANTAFISNIQYTEDSVIVAYRLQYVFETNEDTGEIEFVKLDKNRVYIQRIGLSDGNIDTLLYREEYDAYVSGILCDNILCFNYSYYNEPSTGELETPETHRRSQGGFYIQDISTGEEKFCEGKNALGITLGHFSPNKFIALDRERNKLCLFDGDKGEFADIADCDMISYTEDEKDALFTLSKEDEYFTRYNFESGELSQIPRPKGKELYLNMTHIVGNTVWVELGDSKGYISRDDFFDGKFENIKVIEEAELQ